MHQTSSSPIALQICDVELASAHCALTAARAEAEARRLDREAASQHLARFDAALQQQMRDGLTIEQLRVAYIQRREMVATVEAMGRVFVDATHAVDTAIHVVVQRQIAKGRLKPDASLPSTAPTAPSERPPVTARAAGGNFF